MINQAIKDYDVDPKDSFLIGDSQRDVDAAEAAGVKGYLFTGTNLLDFIKTIIQLIITITLFYASLMSVLR